MEMRFKDLINNLDHDELLALRKDLQKGSIGIKKVIEEKIRDNERGRERYCAVCDKKLDIYTANYTLLFGPDDFKKRASFCAIDCLEYFTNYLKDLKNPEKKLIKNEGEKFNIN
jgi:hypothetical protein